MKLRFSFLLARRFLGLGSRRSVSNARRSLFGAIAGIGISLIPLVIVLVVSDGMIEGITSRIIALGTSHIQISNYSGNADVVQDAAALRDFADDIVLRDTSGSIVGAWGEKQGTAIAIGSTGRSGAAVRAIDPAFFKDNSEAVSFIEVTEGSIAEFSGNDAFIGTKLAQNCGLQVGDRVRLITQTSAPGGNLVPRVWTFTVRAVISSGYQELDALWFFIPLDQGFRVLPGASSRTLINIVTDNAFADLEPVIESLYPRLPEYWSAYTWKDLNRSQFQSFRTTKVLLMFIMMLIVFVASVNVSSALVMLVMERRQEIAILKSTGASPEDISAAFVLSGFLTGLAGVLAGLPAGILCGIHINKIFIWMEQLINAVNTFKYRLFGTDAAGPYIHLLDPEYYLEYIPVTLHLLELFLIGAGTLVLSVLVSLLPAIRAGAEKPLETLRKY